MRFCSASWVVLMSFSACTPAGPNPGATPSPELERGADTSAGGTPSAPTAHPKEPLDTSHTDSVPRPAASANSARSTDDREAIAVCEHYRRASESRDVSALLALASRDYLEDGGTPDPGDDMDYDALERFLRGPYQEISDVHYTFTYERVEWRGDTVVVDYSFLGSYRTKGLERRVEDTNRLTLKREGNDLKIIAGM